MARSDCAHNLGCGKCYVFLAKKDKLRPIALLRRGSLLKRPNPKSENSNSRMATILIAEDDPEINALMALTLRLEGYEIVQARDGEMALESARDESRTPDLILLDVMMPRLTGYEVARTLQADNATSHIPIIFVTAKHNTEDLVRGLEMGVDYVCKPFAMPELLARVKAALRMRKLQDDLRVSNEQLARLAITDGLTGLTNRRGFGPFLEDELWRACRFGHPIALLLFDLDHFKKVNDTWGHPQGDAVLKAFAKVLDHSSRRVDKVARFGGEEFAALLPGTDAEGAHIFAEKVRLATAALQVPRVTPDGIDETLPPVQVTVSIGCAVAMSIVKCMSPIAALADNLLHISDQCLYKAKAAGRNTVVTESIVDLGAVANDTRPSQHDASQFSEANQMRPSAALDALGIDARK